MNADPASTTNRATPVSPRQFLARKIRLRAWKALGLAAALLLPAWAVAADVVFKDKQGRVLTRDDLKGADGKFDWEVQSGTPVPEQARKLHQLGREAGQRGNYQAANDYFEQAAKAAPNWAYPLYDAAFTYLLIKDATKAYEYYRKVDAMSPRGFFTVKTAVHTLERERSGQFPPGTYVFFLGLEWTSDAAQKQQIVDTLTTKIPAFAPGWKEKALLENNPQKRLAYLDRGLAASPDLETRGFLLLNKATVLAGLGKKAEAVDILGQLALDPASPRDVEAIAKRVLASLNP